MLKRIVFIFILFQLISYNVYALDGDEIRNSFYQILLLIPIISLLVAARYGKQFSGLDGLYISCVVDCSCLACFCFSV